IIVDDADRPYSSRRQVKSHGRTEATRANAEHLRIQEFRLPLLPHIWQGEVPGITRNLLLGELTVSDPLIPSILPSCIPARHGDDVFVAHLFQGPRRDQRPHSA